MILLSVPSQQRGNADSALGPPCFTVFPNMSQALSVLFYNSNTGDLGTVKVVSLAVPHSESGKQLALFLSYQRALQS